MESPTALLQLFQASVANNSTHITNIYNENELAREATVKLDIQIQID